MTLEHIGAIAGLIVVLGGIAFFMYTRCIKH